MSSSMSPDVRHRKIIWSLLKERALHRLDELFWQEPPIINWIAMHVHSCGNEIENDIAFKFFRVLAKYQAATSNPEFSEWGSLEKEFLTFEHCAEVIVMAYAKLFEYRCHINARSTEITLVAAKKFLDDCRTFASFTTEAISYKIKGDATREEALCLLLQGDEAGAFELWLTALNDYWYWLNKYDFTYERPVAVRILENMLAEHATLFPELPLRWQHQALFGTLRKVDQDNTQKEDRVPSIGSITES